MLKFMNSKTYSLLLTITMLMATLTLVLAYNVAPASAQAGTDWPMFRHDPAHTGVSESTAPDKMYVKWRYTTDGPVLSSPAVVGGKVYIGSDDGNLYCLDGNTGSLVWKYKTGNAVESSPAVVGGKVYFGSVDKNVYCLSTDGTLVWKYTTGGYVFSSPTVVDGKVYIGSMDKNLYCLDAANGDVIWTYEAGAFFKVSPAVADGMVYFGSDDRNVRCLDAATGDLIWNYTTGNTIGQSSAAVAYGKVYIGSDDANFYCLDATDGAFLWRYGTEATNYQDFVRCSPAVSGNIVYIGLAHQLAALDVETGAPTGSDPKWVFHTGSIQRSSPAIADGNLYTGHNDLSIYIFDAMSGARKQSYFASSPWESSVAIANGKIYCGNGNDDVYCFEEVTGTVPTTISCDVFPTSLDVGFQVSVQGNVFPGVSWLNVDLTYTKPDGTTIAQTLIAKSDGLYAGSYTVDVPGVWTVQANFNGHDVYDASTSSAVSFTVTGTAPPTPLTASAITCDFVPSNEIAVSGSIIPGVSGATVTLTHLVPDGTSKTITVTTEADGTYESSYAPTVKGNWIVQASWAGDATHKAATSNMVTITAAAASAAVDIPMEYVYLIVAIIVIVVALVAAYIYTKKK